jgi:outer membrane protein assembly factor BamB
VRPALRRFTLLLTALSACSCAARAPLPLPPIFPMRQAWTAPLPGIPEEPLATDGQRLFVTTRDGSLVALDLQRGDRLWELAEVPGKAAAAAGAVVLRQSAGTVVSFHPKNGGARWSVESGVSGSLPPVIDGDRVFVAGRGVAALDLESGRVLWRADDGAEATAPVVASGSRLYVGESDGTLRARSREDGKSIWMLKTAASLAAPPVVDGPDRLFLGTRDRRILALGSKDGEQEWRWKVGADIQGPGLVYDNRVVFAAFDAVLWALDRGNGNLAWRGLLTSRPIGGPIQVDGVALVACHENEVLGFDLRTGRPIGGLRTTAVIATPLLVVERRLFLGLRDRTAIALELGATPQVRPAL